MKYKNILSILMTFLMLSSIASAVEIRGTVVEGYTSQLWTAQQFAGFYYDLDKGQSFENLTIEIINSDRTIPADKLIYTTEPIKVNFSYSDDKKLPVYNNVRTYDLVGWQAEKWVAIKSNKLVKLAIETKGTEKVSLQSGGTLTLGNGYVMKINSVDANSAPRQAWVSVMKDGKIIDDAVLRQGELYNLQKDVGGEKDVLVLSAYVSSIFFGTEAQMLQLQYIWLIDESTLIEIKSGDTHGVFKVTGTNPIVLKNSGSITLSRDSDINLMGNMKFKVADSDTLRFYPFVNVIEESIKESVVPVSTINTSRPCSPEIVERIVEKTVEKIVYVNVTVTPEPTPETPGFEAIFAIAGLVVVAFLVLRRKD